MRSPAMAAGSVHQRAFEGSGFELITSISLLPRSRGESAAAPDVPLSASSYGRASYNAVFRAPLAIGRDTRSGSEHRNAVSGAWVIPRSASVRSSDLSFVASDGWTAPTIA